MVNDAEKFKADDEKQKDRIAAKNDLESYCFNMKSTLDEEKLKDKISAAERTTITSACDKALNWLDSNQLAEVDEFQDELVHCCTLFPTKIFRSSWATN